MMQKYVDAEYMIALVSLDIMEKRIRYTSNNIWEDKTFCISHIEV